MNYNDETQRIVDAKKLGLLIRKKRLALGVKQADAAGLSGVGVRFLSELERGKETCELGKVLQVLSRLGLELWVGPRQGRPGGRGPTP